MLETIWVLYFWLGQTQAPLMHDEFFKYRHHCFTKGYELRETVQQMERFECWAYHRDGKGPEEPPS